jgi:general secretion pathway protein G
MQVFYSQPMARERRAGFTLLEVMIVLALIGLIASTMGVALYHRWRDGQISTGRIQVRDIGGRIEQFMVTKYRCPTVEDLISDHYVEREPKDPWGTPLSVRCPGEHQQAAADVVSYGPDRLPNTTDDIKSWEP